MRQDRVLLALNLATEVGLGPKGIDLAKLFKDGEQCISHDHCAICRISQFEQVDSELQEHHVAGRVHGQPNFRDTVTVCRPCHQYLSDHQKDWLVYRRDCAYRLSSYFFGWADIFDLLSQKSGLLGFLRLARKFRSQGWHIRNKIKGR